MNFNNEIIDGQSTVAENLAKSNRNFMLLKEILRSGASSQDIQDMLNTISQTYVKTADIVNNLTSTATNKPVSALQAKNLKQDIANLTQQLQQLNQNVSNLTQQLNNKVDLIAKTFNIQTDDVYKIPSGIYVFGGDSRNNANFPYKLEWCSGVLIKLSGQNFGENTTNPEHGGLKTETMIVLSYGRPVYYNLKAWERWGGWSQITPDN